MYQGKGERKREEEIRAGLVLVSFSLGENKRVCLMTNKIKSLYQLSWDSKSKRKEDHLSVPETFHLHYFRLSTLIQFRDRGISTFEPNC